MRIALALVLLAACAEVDDDRDDVITFVPAATEPAPCLVALPGAGAWHCTPVDPATGLNHCLMWPVCTACDDAADGWCETEFGPMECATDLEAACPPVPEGW